MDWTHFVKPGLDSFVKHGLDSFCKTWTGLICKTWTGPALSQSGEISPDFCRFYGGGIRHNEDIMHSFQNFIVWLIPNHPLPLETRIWKLVVRALDWTHL